MALGDNLQLARRLGATDPRQIAASTTALARWGPSLAAPYAAAALRHPGRAAVVDHRRSISYADLDRSSTALAKGLRAVGLEAGDHVGVLCHNHRDFVEASIATAKAGNPCVYLNTGFASSQLGEVLDREGVRGIVCDAELLPIVEGSSFDGIVIVADGDSAAHRSLDDVRALATSRPLLPSKPWAPVLLTSGTTGTPKGARRHGRPTGLASAIGLLQRIPYRNGDISVIPTIAIKQLEVLRDGASSQYGSDAIAGVLNFILKDNFEE